MPDAASDTDGTPRQSSWPGDATVFAALTLLALLIRLPNLQTIPRLTDETAETAIALGILQGARPLTLADAYNGAHWAYLLAAVLGIFGLDPAIPRLFAAGIGALTAGGAYLLARTLGNRQTGLLAALLMATSMAHVVLMSHVAWNNHATPLWITLALWLTALAFSPRRLAARHWQLAFPAAGALWGLALASHPSAAAPLAGAAMWALAAPERRRLLGSGQGVKAVLALGLVVAPLVVHSIQNPFAYLNEALGTSQPVARDRGPAAVAVNAVGLAAQLGRTAAAGPLVEAGDPLPTGADLRSAAGVTSASGATPAANRQRASDIDLAGLDGRLVALTDALRSPITAIYAMMLLAALLRTLVTGPRLLGTTAIVGLLSLPIFNRSYDNFFDARYLGYLLPLAYTALALWITTSAWPASADGAGPRRSLTPDSDAVAVWRFRQGAARAAAVALIGAFATYPLVAANSYYLREAAAGRTNAPMLNALAQIVARPPSQASYTLVDKAMRPIKQGGGGDPTRSFDQLLTLSRVPHALADDAKMRWFLRQSPDTSYFLVVADTTAESLRTEFELEEAAPGDGWRLLVRPAGNGR